MHAALPFHRARLAKAIAETLVLLGISPLALAGNILPVPCASADLITAIDQANAESGDTLVLAAGCTYTLTVANNFWYGPTALPPIQSTMTIEGNGATLQASHTGDPTPTTANAFRLFYVSGGMESPPGDLTLHNLTLSGGYTKGGDSLFGGQGAGMGGAIFNQGNLALRAVTVIGNTAHGGNYSGYGSIRGGGGMGEDSAGDPGSGMGGPLSGSFFPLSVGGSGKASGGGGGGGFLSADSGAPGASGADGLGGKGGGVGGLGGLAPGSPCDPAEDGGCGSHGYGGYKSSRGGGFGDGGPRTIYGAVGAAGGGGVGGGGGSGAGGGFGGGGGRYGNGGFGGGGGGFYGSTPSGGFGGGSGGAGIAAGGNVAGGAGGGLGGAIFNHAGSMSLSNVTLTGNAAEGGLGGPGSGNGSGLGGAIFNLNGSIEISFSTIAQNSISGSNGAGIGGGPGDGAIYSLAYGNDVRNGALSYARLNIANSIVFGTSSANGAGQNDVVNNAVDGRGSNLAVLTFIGSNIVGNLSNVSLLGLTSTTPLTTDPTLGALTTYAHPNAPGTLPISAQSPAYDAAASCNDVDGNPVPTDERGVTRPQFTQCDLGAYELDNDSIFANGFE